MGGSEHIFMLGIGGSGMSGIAEVLAQLGYRVTGSDMHDSAVVKRLRSLGIEVHIGHRASNIEGAEVLVKSSAIPADNPELVAAHNSRIPVLPRAEMLAELMRYRRGIAVAGTHGKTTTTSLLASIFGEAGEDPTFVIGGVLNNAGSNARLGAGQYLIVEADESDASFLHLLPTVSVVTNIEADHMDHYDGDTAHYEQAFLDFMHNLPFYGLAILCLDDPGVQRLLPQTARRTLTYGRHSDADYRVSEVAIEGLTTRFILERPEERPNLTVKLSMPGEHNALNAAAAAAVATELGLPDQAIEAGLQDFSGVGRRFSVMGELSLSEGSALLVDDYGHHPTEVRATLAAARAAFPDRRVVMVFQPHRYTRTRDFYEDFVAVLSDCDLLLLLEVYAAGEEVIAGADGRSLARSIRQRGSIEPIFVPDPDGVPEVLRHVLEPRDLVLTQGAGNVGQLARLLADGPEAGRSS
ncbi:MAG: UDP-N-acetylmuramate--L-alanine ligase [Luminiphilus sp.]